jgi:hypothetical protein
LLKVHINHTEEHPLDALPHARHAISARFDYPNLMSLAGLVAVRALADRC